MRNKKEIQGLIADGQLSDAAQSAFEYAEACGDADTLNGVIALQADFEKAKQVWTTNQISFEEFSRAQARVTQALLSRLDELPDEPTPKATRRRVKESHFKWQMFYLFITAKFVVFGWAAFMWRYYGFQNAEAFSLFNALLPGFILNASIMFRSLFQTGVAGNVQRRYVPLQFRNLIWLIFPSYIALQIFITIKKVQGDLPFEMATVAFLAVETGLGVFMGEMVDGLFKKKA